ncbi:MAG TPA: efflux RND transporter periplasmic adaptor subunit [Candidatus Binatia bacterium]|jgi:HlyD family secretion protein|nr:efflux RND transporter periplasmic adaptor subunit [Candidatus Binatia bacterium]
MKRRIPILILVVAVVAAGVYYAATRRPHRLVLTGIVTTDEVIVGSDIQGRIQRLLVQQGDPVTNGQLLAVIQPQEWQADMAFYASTEQQSASQVSQAEADLKYQETQTTNQIRQAEANLAATQAQVTQAQADLEIARLNFDREAGLYKQGVDSIQTYDQTRTSKEGAEARVESLRKQVQAAQAAVALAQANAEQVAARRAAVQASLHQLAAAGAQKEKAQVRLNYTEIRAPLDGIVDLRAARQGEVVSPGQAIVTLINQDNLWVRADVEETYIDRIPIGKQLDVRFPSGTERQGTVFYRSRDADYATQRDVSRTKRDIKTFEIRLRCDNADRSLAVGMTAYVMLDLKKP